MRAEAIKMLALLGALLLCGCTSQSKENAHMLTGGDPDYGATAISRYGCGSCHTIPGIAGAHGQVGPPLTGVRNRMVLAGMVPNTPDGLENWIQDPHSINAKTAMPTMGMSRTDAVDIAAYLYSIDQ